MHRKRFARRSLLAALAAMPMFGVSSCVERASDFLLGEDFFDERDTGDRLDDLVDDFEDLFDDFDDLF